MKPVTLADKVTTQQIDQQKDIPYLVWLLENPNSPMPLPGAINLFNHDCLHILLERGVSSCDEAYIIGFTMSNDAKTNPLHCWIFKLCALFLYPPKFRLRLEELSEFDQGFQRGQLAKTKNLNHIDFKQYLNEPIPELKKRLI